MNISKIILLIIFTTSLFSEDNLRTNFNYFGNLSASKLSEEGFDLNNYNHNSVDNSVSFSPYSKAGAQLSLNYKDFTFTAQALVRKKHEGYKADLTWLNLKYDVSDNFSLRVGRIQTKIFLHSESIDIDYLHLWTKPPVELYSVMPVRTYNGIELNYNNTFDEYTFNLSLVPFGVYETKINGTKDTETSLKLDNSYLMSLSLENDNFLYKISYSKTDTDIPDNDITKTINAGLSAYGNDMDRFTYMDRVGKLAAMGFQYRGDNLSIDTEIAYFKSNSLLASSKSAYIIAGYRINKFTPFLMYAQNNNDKSYYDTSSITVVDETSATLKRALDDTLYLNNYSLRTSSIGVRYDIAIGLALKAQIDRMVSKNYGDITSAGVEASGYEKVGTLSRDAGTSDKPIYAYTIGLSFAY